MKDKNKEIEIIEPIKKEVKRPLMKAISKVTIPLTIFLVLLIGTIYFSFYLETYEGSSITEKEWEEYEEMGPSIKSIYGGFGSYDEYKESVWKSDYSMIPLELLIGITIGSGVLGFVSRNAYKKGQEEE